MIYCPFDLYLLDMGYYINQSSKRILPVKGKADILIQDGDATEMKKPTEFPKHNVSIVCVVDNGVFEAAGLAYDENELRVMSSSTDPRPKRWLLMNKQLAEKLAGYPG